MRAELACEALREDRRDGGAGEKRLDSHLVQAGQRLRCVVRVQRRKHEVAGEGGLDRNLCRLAVADLADHHDVGVGAQDRAQRRRERQPCLLVDLNLVHALKPVLDRILDRDDVDLGAVDVRQGRVERRRLTGAGRPGHEQRAGRLAHDRLELAAHVIRHAELLERRSAL